jgi:hypothetical protein
MDPQGVEAGLAFIGNLLENAERKISEHWAAYEERRVERQMVPVVKYPDRYSLKSDEARIDESKKLSEIMYTVPGRTIKQELAKCIVSTLLSGRVSVDVLEKINREVDTAEYTTSDPQTIIDAKEAGLVGEQVASKALGFLDDEYLTAREDHVSRIERIAEAQGQNQGMENPAARGLSDMSDDPSHEAAEEKEEASDTTMEDSTEKPVRGEGEDTNEDED